MTGEAHWLTPAVMLIGLAAIALLAWASLHLWTRFRWRTMEGTCPVSREPVLRVVKVDATTGRYVDVERCTARPDPDRVDCDKDCIGDLNKPRPPRTAA